MSKPSSMPWEIPRAGHCSSGWVTGPLSVSQLAAPLAVSLAAVVQHLQVLEQSDLIRTEKVGRVRTCTIAPGGLDIAEQWLQGRRALTERRLDRLGALLAQEDGAAPAEMGEDEQ